MNADDTKVLIGGRKLRKIPPQSKLFVEHEENTHQGSVRQRRPVLASTPNHYQGHTCHQPPPPYNSSSYWTPPNKTQVHGHQHLYDSGYQGYSPQYSKTQPYQSLPVCDKAQSKSYLDILCSPVSNIKSRLSARSKGRGGRSSFFDDESSAWWKVSPQHVLGFLLFITIFSSLGFAIVISIKNIENGEAPFSSSLNGKYGSIKFGNERSSIKDNKREKIEEEPLFAVWDEIGQMSDKMIAEKLATEELESKIKASKINIKKVEKENQNVESNYDGSLTRELLTHHPLVEELSQKPTEAPDIKLGRISETVTTEFLIDNNIAEKVPKIEKVTVTPIGEMENIKTKLEATDTAEEPIDWENLNEVSISHLGSENMDNMCDVKMEPSPEVILSFNKKTKRVNPLLQNVITMKMSRPRKTLDKITSGDDDESASADYPDDPTFRGVKGGEDEQRDYDIGNL